MKTDIDHIIRGSSRPLVIAHRGASFYHRENTLEAFRAALEMGPDMIELDVRRTADGALVVHHDPDFGGEKIADMAMDRVAEKSGAAGYAVPALTEVLELCADRILLDIELKEDGYEEQAAKTVLDAVGPRQFLVSSMHDQVIGRIRDLRPEIRTGLVLCRTSFPGVLRHLRPEGRVRRTGADVLAVGEGLLNLGFLRLNAGLRKPVWVYTVNDRKKMWKHIADPRVGGIFTDRPDVGLFLRDLCRVGRSCGTEG